MKEHIETLKKMRKQTQELMSLASSLFKTYEAEEKALTIAIDLMQKHEDGLGVVLPCKVGDTIYTTFEDGITEHKVHGFRTTEHEKECMCKVVVLISRLDSNLDHQDIPLCKTDSFGKTVFLTPEAAKEAKEPCQHDKSYSPNVLTSNPPQYPWVCRKCGATGTDTATLGPYANDYKVHGRAKRHGALQGFA